MHFFMDIPDDAVEDENIMVGWFTDGTNLYHVILDFFAFN